MTKVPKVVGGRVACIGGSVSGVSALDNIASVLGGQSSVVYMSTLVTNTDSIYRPRLDFSSFRQNKSDINIKLSSTMSTLCQ